MSYFVLFDDAINNSARLYQEYKYSIFIKPANLNKLDGFLQQGWDLGLHAVIFADYEFGLALQQLPEKTGNYLVLHWFAKKTAIDNVKAWLNQQTEEDIPAGISQVTKDTEYQSYLDSIEQIKQAISNGETYQINYTVRLHLLAYGNPIKLYHRLRQPVPYAVLAKLPDITEQTCWTLSFSPELFLNISKNGLIKAKPMKGTAPILDDGKNQARADYLHADPKNRAENIMIVDLLRNDLGKIAQTGSVKVSDLFKVSRFGNVLQMTTTIQAQPLSGINMSDIFRATFPCGSITGAPKRRSMQLIDKLESSNRGLYTGTIGWLDQCNTGLGFYGNLNIVIRTLQLKSGTGDTYTGTYGVGSGIVTDSIGTNEFDECTWKSGFLSNLQPEVSLFETMRVKDKQCDLAETHLLRLYNSALAINIKFNPEKADELLKKHLVKLPDNNIYRVKMILDSGGKIAFTNMPLQRLKGQQAVIISEQRLNNHNYLRRFKSSQRSFYDKGWQQAIKKGAFDSLFFNQDGYLLEGGRSSVFILYKNQWHTPSLSLDILDGIMRRQVINHSRQYLNTDHVNEGVITHEMLFKADEIKLCNGLHGIFSVRLQTE